MNITFSDSSLYYTGSDPYFQAKIPEEYFVPNSLEKIDVAPQRNASNSAFMIYFKDASACAGNNEVGGGGGPPPA